MRRALIISTTFFPDPGVSAIRMTQWCRHLPKYGWQPHVLCRYYGFRATGEDLAQNVHPDVRVVYLGQSRDRERDGIARLMRRLARRAVSSCFLNGVFVPDVSICFWRKIRSQVLEQVRTVKPDVIITTSPPFSNHDIGIWLTRQTGIPWVADFRDPYLIDKRFKPTGLGRLRWRAHERFLENIYRRAWLVTNAIPIDARWARRRFPFARDRIRILTNGFPLELVNELAVRSGPQSPRKRILVAGTIREREQLHLARAVAELGRRGDDVELRLVGKIPERKKELEQRLGNRFVATGYVQHRQSLREIADAAVLVSYLDEFQSESRLLSMKLLEYLASNKPTVVINPSRSECVFLRRVKGVETLRHPDPRAITAALAKALQNNHRRCVAELEEFRRDYIWAELSRMIASWLDKLVEFPPAAAPRLQPTRNPLATIVISTRNRKESLRQSILSALNQSAPVEVIVADDGSTDGTAHMVRTDFPQVRLVRHEQSQGLIVRRNECARLASAAVIFSIDDDAEYSSANVVAQTIAEFDHKRVGAVAMPCINVRNNQLSIQRLPNNNEPFVIAHFVGTAYAVRRDVFLTVGGYRQTLIHQGEEQDFCLRMMARGWVVRLGGADPIRHYESPLRNVTRMNFFGRRNDILFAWHNVPMPLLPAHLAGTTFNGLLTSFRTGHLLSMSKGIAAGYKEVLRAQQVRQPVAANLYRLHRRLKKRGPQPLEVIESELPPLPPDQLGVSASAAMHVN
jgi:glycosyltransferase involved in cell wall biosynthesis/GT2 family glycosyltransferase